MLSSLYLFADILLIGFNSVLITVVMRKEGEPPVVTLLKIFVWLGLHIQGWAMILGYAGIWTIGLQFACHFVEATVLTFIFRKRLLKAFQRRNELRENLEAVLRQWFCPRDRWEAIWGGLLVAVMGLFFFFCLALPPLNSDSLAYRLPTGAHWLQERSIRHFETYYSVNNTVGKGGTLFMAWVFGHYEEGYPMVRCVQWFFGISMLVGMAYWGRVMGFSRTQRLLGMLLFLSFPNTGLQFMTSQIDLLTAAWVFAGLTLIHAGIRRGTISFAGAWAIGLGFAAKGTSFYFAPGIAVMICAWVWIHRQRWRLIPWQGAAIGAAILTLAGPPLIENRHVYGNFFSDPEMLSVHHIKEPSLALFGEKLKWDLTCYGIANLQPVVQPLGLGRWLAPISEWAIDRLPDEPGHGYGGAHQKENLARIVRIRQADVDASTFGLIPIVLLFIGTACIVAQRIRGPATSVRLAMVGVIGITLFALVFMWFHNWFRFSFRYFIHMSPWMALTAMWMIAGHRWTVRSACGYVFLGAQITVIPLFTFNSVQAGLRPFLNLHHYESEALRTKYSLIASQFDSTETLALDLMSYSQIAYLYRNRDNPRIRHVKSDDLDRYESSEAFFADNPDVHGLLGALDSFIFRYGKVRVASIASSMNDATRVISLLIRPVAVSEEAVARHRGDWLGHVGDFGFSSLFHRQIEESHFTLVLNLQLTGGDSMDIVLDNPGESSWTVTAVTPNGEEWMERLDPGEKAERSFGKDRMGFWRFTFREADGLPVSAWDPDDIPLVSFPLLNAHIFITH